MTEHPSPAALGYRMPAEWETHAATWLAWPHNLETWPSDVLPLVENTYLSIIRALAPDEKVSILVSDPAARDTVEKKIGDAGISIDLVRLFTIPTDDAWIRDYGPNFLVQRKSPDRNPKMSPGVSKPALRGGVAFNNWGFDSWGGKYDGRLDDEAGGKIAERLAMATFAPGIVLEGGAIDVNGVGTCLTTEPCLLNPNRNGRMDRERMEGYLKNFLGVQKIIWLKGGIEGDDTDGHIDNLARFVNPTTVVCASEEDASDPNYEGLKENHETLSASKDQDGNPLNVIRLPTPGVVKTGNTRLPASYANFYIGNGTVLLPVYNAANDLKAQSVLQEAFSDREVVPIACRELVQGLGGIHCITQQQPR